MRDILTPGARIVNISSHLGHLSHINGEAKKAFDLRETMADKNISESVLGRFSYLFIFTFLGKP